MASGDHLPLEDHVARYCKPRTIQDGVPGSTAFELREGEPHLSVNWLEFFGQNDREAHIGYVCRSFIDKGYQLSRNGRFAVLNVGESKHKIKTGAEIDARILHWLRVR